MKHFIAFNLPEEKSELELTMKAGEYYGYLHDIWQWTRSLRKFDERENIPREEVISKLYELMGSFDI